MWGEKSESEVTNQTREEWSSRREKSEVAQEKSEPAEGEKSELAE